ncbi:hypothetical protein [Curtobacterium sp. B18]|uniref:hypothetical protein n=1 Tax=Curtobacterium sp. B18 TaxID=95614 RepID=UPI00034B9F4E|nr:hypothetical protein [Curtobacterium sp. B18]
MTVLIVVTLAGSLVALVLGVAGRRRAGWSVLVGETVMLAAMADVHVPTLGFVPAPFWAVLLGGCALVTALLDRLRRPHRPQGDHLHALGMLLGAAFVLLGAVHAGDSAGHRHGTVLLLPIAVAVAVHVGAVAWGVARRPPARVESARRIASLVGVLAMGAMTAVH